ncbi:hypothetical protein [Streptomyces sp. NBC_01361]|uniref:hypothetical protein n=1 Tax=Streptomyces sp. NBC_01361 TaxID=2903838 RepID=UPI002E351CCA|nr:hypothetical protein [Streptomyces sp. NBC_01361]
MHVLTVRPKTHPQRTAAASMRAIAHRTPRFVPESVCEREQCLVAWAGEEADCWNCGMPATVRSTRRGSALQRLLAAVDPHNVTAGINRKAALA